MGCRRIATAAAASNSEQHCRSVISPLSDCAVCLPNCLNSALSLTLLVERVTFLGSIPHATAPGPCIPPRSPDGRQCRATGIQVRVQAVRLTLNLDMSLFELRGPRAEGVSYDALHSLPAGEVRGQRLVRDVVCSSISGQNLGSSACASPLRKCPGMSGA